MNDFKKASEIISKVFSGIDMSQGKEIYSFFSGWEKIAGIDIASHTQIKEIEKGILIVIADHPGWMQMLQVKKKSILRNCSKVYPALGIKDIRFILDTTDRTIKISEKKQGLHRESGIVRQEKKEERVNKKEFTDLLKTLEKRLIEKNDNIES